MVTVQCQPSDVNLMFTTSVFEVLSVDTILIAFITALSEQRENNLNSGAWPGPFSFSLKNRKFNVFAVETFMCTWDRVYLANADWLSGKIYIL